jgi:uncharacterized protein YcfL|tara:strand:- start:185 stop:391 length:207 start_codon:yes stop_codon:yes gene_type:complete
MKIIILLLALFMIGCVSKDSLNVRPSKTTVTYGTSTSTAEKDAKNDVLTDTKKQSWNFKQEFIWGKNK